MNKEKIYNSEDYDIISTAKDYHIVKKKDTIDAGQFKINKTQFNDTKNKKKSSSRTTK